MSARHIEALTHLAGLGSAYCSKETGTGDVDSVRGWRGFAPTSEPSVRSRFRDLPTPSTSRAQAETRATPRSPEQAQALGQTNVEMPWAQRFGPVWPVGMPSRITYGFGASGASPFTMTAAQALNDHLETNNCAGCSDMTSQLRQLTFAFKAAYLTDTGITPQISLNMSSALAMTAYGSGTDQALAQVLGAAKSYSNGPCTDDSGNCLGNRPTPIIPSGASALEQQIVHAIKGALQQVQFLPQPEIVNGLLQGFAALINQIGFELAKLKPVTPVSLPVQPAPTPPPPEKVEAKGWTTTEKFLVGGAVGVAIAGAGLLIYYGKRS